MKRVVKIHSVNAEGISLEVRFKNFKRGLPVYVSRGATTYDGEDLRVISPSFSSIEDAEDWLKETTDAVLKAKKKRDELLEAFKKLEGEVELGLLEV